VKPGWIRAIWKAFRTSTLLTPKHLSTPEVTRKKSKPAKGSKLKRLIEKLLNQKITRYSQKNVVLLDNYGGSPGQTRVGFYRESVWVKAQGPDEKEKSFQL